MAPALIAGSAGPRRRRVRRDGSAPRAIAADRTALGRNFGAVTERLAGVLRVRRARAEKSLAARLPSRILAPVTELLIRRAPGDRLGRLLGGGRTAERDEQSGGRQHERGGRAAHGKPPKSGDGANSFPPASRCRSATRAAGHGSDVSRPATTSSPTRIVPSLEDVGAQAAAVDEVAEDPVVGEPLEVGAGLAQAAADALGLADAETAADERVEVDAAGDDVAARFGGREAELVDDLGLDQRQVVPHWNEGWRTSRRWSK